MKRINFWLSEDLLDRLRKARLQTGMSVVEFVRRAIDAALFKEGL